ncbi:unnamed protein product [Closterium sp. Yama58-4]|nr:unnamed protein product [Closterium sp. Yama58-4]
MARFNLLAALVLLLAVTVTLASFASTAAARPVRFLGTQGYTSDGKSCIEVESIKGIDGYCTTQTKEPASSCQDKLNRWIADCNNPKGKGFWKTVGRYFGIK